MTTLEVGTELPSITTSFTRATLVRYAGASTDFNPIHWSESAAAALGLPTVIAHGMFTMGLALRVVTDSLRASSAAVMRPSGTSCAAANTTGSGPRLRARIRSSSKPVSMVAPPFQQYAWASSSPRSTRKAPAFRASSSSSPGMTATGAMKDTRSVIGSTI